MYKQRNGTFVQNFRANINMLLQYTTRSLKHKFDEESQVNLVKMMGAEITKLACVNNFTRL